MAQRSPLLAATLAALALPITLPMAISAHAESWPAPIQALVDEGLQIHGEFDAPEGLQGYAASHQGREMTLFLTADGEHAIVGTLVDAEGNDLSEAPSRRWCARPLMHSYGRTWSRATGSRTAIRRRPGCFIPSPTPTAPTACGSGRWPAPGSRQARCSCAMSWSASCSQTARPRRRRCLAPTTRPLRCTTTARARASPLGAAPRDRGPGLPQQPAVRRPGPARHPDHLLSRRHAGGGAAGHSRLPAPARGHGRRAALTRSAPPGRDGSGGAAISQSKRLVGLRARRHGWDGINERELPGPGTSRPPW